MVLVQWSRVFRLALAAGLLVSPGGRIAQAQDVPADTKPEAKDSAQAKPATAEKAIAVFRLSGPVTELPADTTFSFGSASGVSLRDLVARMRKAADDENVPAVVLLLEGASVGQAQIEELRQAMAYLQSQGKPIHAHADQLSMGGYVLLSGVSRLSVVPTADLWISGLYAEAPYLRGLLDKLGVQPDYLTCGPYKSAAEMFTRTGPSPEAEQMENWLLDSMFATFLKLIAEGRKVEEAKAQSWIDEGPYTANSALKAGLVDAVEHRQEFEAMLKAKYGDDVAFNKNYGKKVDPKPDFSSPFGLIKFWGELLNSAKPADSKKPAVGIVYVNGPILLGNSQGMSILASEAALSSEIRRALDKAADDDAIKAVVLRVDSPGGSAVASEIILDATRRVKAKKPFVVSMGNVAGSGGYYVACASDVIYADRSTITGSIGVVGGKFGTQGLFDKVGVNFHPYKRGKNAGMLSSGTVFTPDEKVRMQAWMDEIYGVFKGHVTESRGDRLKKPIDELAGGRVYTGQQALELGLVDRLGTLEDATTYIAEQAQLKPKDYDVRVVPKPKSFLEALLEDAANESDNTKGLDVETAPRLPSLLGRTSLLDLAQPLLGQLDPRRAATIKAALGRLEMLQREGVILMMPELNVVH